MMKIWSLKGDKKTHRTSDIQVIIQSRTLNFATSAGAMNRFAPTKVAKFKVRDCINFDSNKTETFKCNDIQALNYFTSGIHLSCVTIVDLNGIRSMVARFRESILSSNLYSF